MQPRPVVQAAAWSFGYSVGVHPQSGAVLERGVCITAGAEESKSHALLLHQHAESQTAEFILQPLRHSMTWAVRATTVSLESMDV